MTNFVKVAKKSDIVSGKMKEVKIKDLIITLASSEGKYLAFEGLCTHKKCPMAGGILLGNTVTCFCHGAKFDIETGNVLSGPATVNLHIYKVKIEGEDILVEI